MHAANLLTALWPEVLRYVVEVDILSPTKALSGMTPTEKLTGKKPSISQLKVCGCVGYVFIPKEVRKNKLSAKAEPAIFLGFPRNGHGFRLLHLRTGKIVDARVVKFREDVTFERTYINALLKGRQHYYPMIPFIPPPVEYVAEPHVCEHACETMNKAVNETADAACGRKESHTIEAQTQTHESRPSVREQASNDSVGADEKPTNKESSNNSGCDGAAGSATPTPTRNQLKTRSGISTAEPIPQGPQPRRSSKRERGLRRSKRKREANRRLSDYIMATIVSLDALTGHPGTPDIALSSPQRDKWWTAMKLEIEAHSINGT
ncbi:unnamed protein product [Phytophthora fragariaefolia]|uniref:Unnamed protein product n=1 Tax=Phytophthora fragariaefolia TaxID=1490495 RepID=A0A9W7DBR8_9STRA|nr:unnamed protein product [Phytophthora fragariaefolia]